MPTCKTQQKVLVSALMLAFASASGATTVSFQAPESVALYFGTGSYTYSFEPTELQDVDALISIDGSGSVAAFEGGEVSIAVDFVTGASQTIAYVHNQVLLSDPALTNLAFTPGTVNGLTFTYVDGLSYGGGYFAVSKGTFFNFAQVPAAAPVTGVPEPLEVALLLSGGAALWQRLRRRGRVDQPGTSQTNSAYLPPAPRAIGST